MHTRNIRRAGIGLLAAAALAGGATACNSHSEHPAPAAPAAHNPQDGTFAQMMVPHHQQAITMSEHELAVGTDPAVKDLAARIKQDQEPEIRKMRGWLDAWHVHGGTAGHHGHGSGVMSPQQMDQFRQARGGQADRAFLQMMIEHHQGAVDMARAEQRAGQDPRAKQLADSIVEGQQGQISQMQRMLGR